MNKEQLQIKSKLNSIGFEMDKPSAFKITKHYKNILQENPDSLFASQPFSSLYASPQYPKRGHQRAQSQIVSTNAFLSVDCSGAANRLIDMTTRLGENY
jgi:hypothetical protein